MNRNARKQRMQHPLPQGGLIRKLWVGETDLYRDHLLRLDRESRRNRFAGTVTDEFVRNYAALSFSIDAIIHGFFVGGTLRGAGELRPQPWAQISAHGLPCQQRANAATRAQV